VAERWERSRLKKGGAHILQNVAAEIITCYERARLAREKSERAINKECKAEFLAAEDHWLGLALSYERQHALSRTVAEFDRRRKASAITRTLREQGLAFDPDDLTRVDIAFHAPSRDAYLQRLGARELVETRGRDVKASGDLFDWVLPSPTAALLPIRPDVRAEDPAAGA
jgi:hypothetical protein